MSIYVIADPHLSFSSDKPMNIFGGWEDYVPRLEKAWRSLITDDDVTVLPGDISWAMNFEELRADFAFLESLPGKKFILKGNHDYWWSTVSKMKAFCADNGFGSIDFIHNCAKTAGGLALCGTRGWFYDLDAGADRKVLLREVGRLRASVEDGRKSGLETVVFLHYPPLYADYRCDEIMDALIDLGVKRCFYGHLHGRSRQNAVTGVREGIEFRLVSADSLGFVPELVRPAEN